jgi:hypothetical protein
MRPLQVPWSLLDPPEAPDDRRADLTANRAVHLGAMTLIAGFILLSVQVLYICTYCMYYVLYGNLTVISPARSMEVSSREQLRLSAIAHVPAPSKHHRRHNATLTTRTIRGVFLTIRLDLFAH